MYAIDVKRIKYYIILYNIDYYYYYYCKLRMLIYYYHYFILYYYNYNYNHIIAYYCFMYLRLENIAATLGTENDYCILTCNIIIPTHIITLYIHYIRAIKMKKKNAWRENILAYAISYMRTYIIYIYDTPRRRMIYSVSIHFIFFFPSVFIILIIKCTLCDTPCGLYNKTVFTTRIWRREQHNILWIFIR